MIDGSWVLNDTEIISLLYWAKLAIVVSMSAVTVRTFIRASGDTCLHLSHPLLAI